MSLDMTFCTRWRECADGATCFRALTPEVQLHANRVGKWLSMSDDMKCFKPKGETNVEG